MAGIASTEHLTGMLLVAMPNMPDPRFARSVIYLCAHSAEGAMGLIVNQVADNVDFPSVIDQLGIQPTPTCDDTPVHVGGPVESSRGFVLHSPDYVLWIHARHRQGLRPHRHGRRAARHRRRQGPAPPRPRPWLCRLGAGQLDAEIQANGWLLAPADADIVFGRDNTAKWDMALHKIRVDPRLLSTVAGHA